MLIHLNIQQLGKIKMIGNTAALAAALCWALGGLIAVTPVNRLGTTGFNRIRMPLSFLMLSALAFFTDGWSSVDLSFIWYIVFSSIIGIFLGDSALLYTINKIGPRRTGILFAANAPMTAIISFIVFQERLSFPQIAGCSIVLFGVFLAIAFGTTSNQCHKWEQVKGNLFLGVLTGLFSAFCQALSAIVIIPVMESGSDPISISALRVGISSVVVIMYSWIRSNHTHSPKYSKPTIGLVAWIACCGFIGMGMGMTFLLFGLSKGEAGIITALAATTPVMMLPLLWFKTGERPSLGSWFGAILTVVGSGILFNL
jgi:drug/metabolite transporter (DMT)-like permease